MGKGIQVEEIQKHTHNWKELSMSEQRPVGTNVGGKLQRQVGAIHRGS